ncbi:MAG: hypothetical protein P8Y18_02025 [Candidatus Bathyarchaeota archaeon]
MGEVYKPDDFIGGKRRPSDLSPGLGGVTPTTLNEIIREIRLLRNDVEKIKLALRAKGINVE